MNWSTSEILGQGSFVERGVQALVLPLTITDGKAALWRGRPPFWPIRICIAALILFCWYQLAFILFRLTHYALDFLPEPPEKDSEDKKKKQRGSKKKRKGSNSNLISKATDWLADMRGGAISKSLTSSEREEIVRSVDPIFLLIHLEKIRRIIHLKKGFTDSNQKIQQSLKMKLRPKTPFLAYLGLAILTIGSRLEIRNSVNHLETVNQIETIQRISSLEELYHDLEFEETKRFSTQIIAGDKKLNLTYLNKTDLIQEGSKTKRIKKKSNRLKNRERIQRGKVVKFSDLQPLPDLDFDEILTERSHRYPSRIRIQ